MKFSIRDSYLTQLTGTRGRSCRVWLVWRLVVVSEEEQTRVPITDMAAAGTPLYRPQYELLMAFLILERLQPSQPTDYICAAHPKILPPIILQNLSWVELSSCFLQEKKNR